MTDCSHRPAVHIAVARHPVAGHMAQGWAAEPPPHSPYKYHILPAISLCSVSRAQLRGYRTLRRKGGGAGASKAG